MIELTMPKLSDSMVQGTILTWLKADGEQVEAGADLLEIETDKATVTHPAEATGVLHIVAAEGTTLPVGAPIARLFAAGDTPASAASPNGGSGETAASLATGETAGSAATGETGASVTRSENEARPASSGSVRATPLARRAAQVHGISLEEIVGSGPLGRVTRNDVLTRAGIALVRPPVRPEPAPQAANGEHTSSSGKVEIAQPSRIQSLIARRMAEAKATIPHFQVQTEVAADAAFALREQFKADSGSAPSFNDFIVKATAIALREHPLANGSYRDGHFELHSRINIGIAVAADRALVVPTIFDADHKTLGTIAAESRRLAERVRAAQITPAELAGATFTISNLGMYGMTAITPVINPPQAAILGVGAMREVLARVDGEIVDRRLMTLTLSCDHRILYGAEAAEFLSTVRVLLERPLTLVL